MTASSLVSTPMPTARPHWAAVKAEREERLARLYAEAMTLTEHAIHTGLDRDDRAAQRAYDAWQRAKGGAA